jgi:hypothetical protein
MLRRLLIAVFVISLMVAFSGTAYSDIGRPVDNKSKVIVKQTNPNAYLSEAQRTSLTPVPPAALRGSGGILMGPDNRYPTDDEASHLCDFLDYAAYEGVYYGWLCLLRLALGR